jgi:hypothetical protein
MHGEFERKAGQLHKVQIQVETNHNFLEEYYIDMQSLLNQKYASIKAEEENWLTEKEEIKKLVK